MISNLKSQLASLGISDKLPQILEEAARVRCDLGYPIIVSPVCAICHDAGGAQRHGQGTVRNRARRGTQVRAWVITAKLPGQSIPTSYDRITKGAEPIKARPGDLLEPGIDRCDANADRSAPTTICCWLRSIRITSTRRSKPPGRSRPNIRWRRRRSITLVKEITLRSDIKSFHLAAAAPA